MKAILKFDLDKPEEEERFKVFIKAIDLYFCLYDIDSELRNRAKYENDEYAEKFRDFMYEKLKQYDLSLDMLS